jgi:hypothetical protein
MENVAVICRAVPIGGMTAADYEVTVVLSASMILVLFSEEPRR